MLAAAIDHPIGPLTEEQKELLDGVQELYDASLDEAVARLAALEPSLNELENEVRRVATEPVFGAMDAEQREEAIQNVYYAPLNGLVEHASSPLARTHIAWFTARDHLFAIAGLPIPDNGPRSHE